MSLSRSHQWGCSVMNGNFVTVTSQRGHFYTTHNHFFFLTWEPLYTLYLVCLYCSLYLPLYLKKKGSVLRVVTVSQLQCQTWTNTVTTWSAHLELRAFYFVNLRNIRILSHLLPSAWTLCSWKLKWQSSTSSPCWLRTNIMFVQRHKTKDFSFDRSRKSDSVKL